MIQLENNIKNRAEIKNKIKAEIIGPDTYPFDAQEEKIVIDIDNISIINEEDLYKVKQQINGEEILYPDSPLKRYGAAILFPKKIDDELLMERIEESDQAIENNSDQASNQKNIKKIKDKPDKLDIDTSEDYDISLTNSFKPSSFGISLLTDFKYANELFIELEFATYKRKIIESDTGKKITSWFRVPAKDKNQKNFIITFTKKELIEAQTALRKPIPSYERKLEIVAAKREFEDKFLLTISMINLIEYNQDEGMVAKSVNKKGLFSIDENSFFQCQIKKATLTNSIIPYPEYSRFNADDEEENINKLLYRDKKTFAVGHGCAASWDFRLTCVNNTFL